MVSTETIDMGFFSKKSPIEKLQKEYERLLKEAHRLSTVDRTKSDAKMAEAQGVLDKIEALLA